MGDYIKCTCRLCGLYFLTIQPGSICPDCLPEYNQDEAKKAKERDYIREYMRVRRAAERKLASDERSTICSI